MTKKFRKMCGIYKLFAKDWECDFSDEAMKEMFDYETFGKGNIEISGFNTTKKLSNGYAIGKKWLNVTVAMWKEDYKKGGYHREYLVQELFRDPLFKDHHEWLIDVLDLRNTVNKFKKELDKLLNNPYLNSAIK